VVASGSDDGKIGIWRVPSDYNVAPENAEEIQDVEPIKFLAGHSKKVGHVQWHPVADNVLASTSHDYSLKIWDVEQGKSLHTLQHPDLITSFAFNYDGSQIATVSRDKVIRVWDIRAEKIISQGPGHTGAKASRVVWLGNSDRIATTGFSRLSDRQLALWNTTDIAAGPIGGFTFLDASAGICMPFYDEGTRCLYLAGKGDGNIRYFEFDNDGFFPLAEYQSVDPQRGVAMLPKRAVAVHDHEVVRFFKTVNDTAIEPVAFIVPRRADTFQHDIYPDCFAGAPSLSADEWHSGKNSFPKVISLEAVFQGTKPIPVVGTGEEAKVIREQASKESLGARSFDSAKEVAKEVPKDTTKETSKPEEIAATPKAEPISLDKKGDGVEDIFKSTEVSSFLHKAAEDKDHPDDKYQESGWNSDDDDDVAVTEVKKIEAVVKTEKEAEPEVAEVKNVKSESEPEPLAVEAETKAEQVVDNQSKVENSISSASNGLSLEDRVNQLSQSVDSLLEQVKLRDDRIEALEQKLSTLTK
jgi:coronin-1B/1C/6